MDSLAVDGLPITEGESGMTLFGRRDSAVHLTASARVVYRFTGAEDAVIGARDLFLRTATYLAKLAGGLALSRSELPRLSRRRSYSDVQIAEGIQ